LQTLALAVSNAGGPYPDLGINYSSHYSHYYSSVGIDLKELGGGQLPKCLKFCPGIEI